jgi:hypothetical protein
MRTSIPLFAETTMAFIRTGLKRGLCFQLKPRVSPTKHPMAKPSDRCPKTAFREAGTPSGRELGMLAGNCGKPENKIID